MKRTILITAAFVLLASVAWAQGGQSTRPRIVPAPMPEATPAPDREQATRTGPPVLIGASKPTPTPTSDAGNTVIADDDEVIRVETNLVTMPVSVLDRDGRFIAGLQQRDFQIFENGVEQKVEFFQSVEQPFTVILMLDVSPSTQFRIEEIRDAAITFVNKLRPGDRVMVIAFDEKFRVLSPPTGDRYMLRNAIMSANIGNGTSLYDSVDQVLKRELPQINGRKAVVLFSDGVDTTSRRSNYRSTLEQASEIDALFYSVWYDTTSDNNVGMGQPQQVPAPRRGGRVTMADILGAILTGGNVPMGRGGTQPSSQDYETGRRYMEELSLSTGGRKFEARTLVNLDAAFSGIAEELRRQYTLGYYPDKVGQIGERKQIKIRVARPNVVVRAKNSYVVGQTDRTRAGK